MSEKTHLLEIYDAEDYQGPNPLHVTGVGVVEGPEHSKYYVIELDNPIQCENRCIRQLALRPHYDGDPIDRTTGSVCTVGIAFAKPGANYVPGQQYGFKDFCFWSVGKIRPCDQATQ